MLDQVTLFGSPNDALRPSRGGQGADGWLAVSPHGIGQAGVADAAQALRSHGGLLIVGSADGVEIHTAPMDGYRPPDRVLLADDAGPRWIEIPGPVALSPTDCLVVPQDRDAQDDLESLPSLLSQLPEDRQGVMWLALARPDAQYRLLRLEEQERELQQVPQPEPAASEPAPAQEPPKKPWALVAGAAVLGAALGVGGAVLWQHDEPPPVAEIETPPPAPRIPLLTVSDMDQLDLAVQRSPKKDALLTVIGKDAELHRMDDDGLIALAKLVLLKADVEGVAKMDREQVIAKVSEMEGELGAYPKLLAQYLCDSPGWTIEPPPGFPPCADAVGADELRRTYFNLLAFIDAKPTP